MSTETCCIDGRPFKKLEREFVCVVCARKVCSDHSTDYRTNPFTGERGHACRRCLAETVEGTLEAQIAALYRQLHSFGPALQALTTEVQALRQQVQSLPPPRPRAPRPAAKTAPQATKPAKTAARKPKPPTSAA